MGIVMKNILVSAAFLAILSGCSAVSSSDSTSSETPAAFKQELTERFADFKNEFIEELWRQNPGYAVYVGYYKYDDQLPVPTPKRRAEQVASAKQALVELTQFDPEKLSPADQIDYYLIRDALNSSIWYTEQFKSYQWVPSQYNVAGVFGVILNTPYKSMDERLRTISKRMVNVPAYYEQAKTNIADPTLEHTELAIQQNMGAAGLFGDSMAEKLKQSSLGDDEKQLFEERRVAALAAINGYVDWLKQQLPGLQEDARSFRIGEAMFAEKFEHDIQSDYSAQELYQLAVAEKENLHESMIEISHTLWSKYFPGKPKPAEPLQMVSELIDKISERHVKREDFVAEVERQIPELREFINANDFIELDPTKPLVVRETPEYQRGVAGASINSPGPYDANANTYYNVTPLDNYTDEQAESYLREYNHYILQILNIHEAIPGHYTQLVYANKSPSLIKSILANGAMIEGWAVYSERLMLEEGYGNDEPELWLMYYKWNLRTVVNAILDYRVHVEGISREEALDLLMNQAFQQETEATGKWRRATLSQVQLSSYFTGYKEIYALREDLKRTSKPFDLKAFHDQFLSYGNAPVKYIRRLMM